MDRRSIDAEKAYKLKAKAKIREFEKNLIIEVKNNQCLYDKNEPSYSNKLKRDEVWSDIALILCKPIDECQKKWSNLRDSFRAYFRAVPKYKSRRLGAVSSIKWVHYESLKFLIPHIKISEDENLIRYMNIKKRKEYAEQESTSNQDWEYQSNTMLQNYGELLLDEKCEGTEDYVIVKKEFDENDKIIMEIKPEIESLTIPQISSDHTSFLKVKSDKEILEPLPKRKFIINKSQKQSVKNGIENKILEMKLKIMERECYIKDLEIYKIENQLNLKPSKYTQHFYKTKND